MNTHDIDFELPEPAGHYYEWDGVYGKRKFTTAPHNGRERDRAVAYYTENQVRAAIEADRKRRGEPVAKVRDRGFEVVDGKHVPTVLVEFPVDDWESRDRFAAAVDAPQPAEPVKVPKGYVLISQESLRQLLGERQYNEIVGMCQYRTK